MTASDVAQPAQKSFASQVLSFGTVQIVVRLRGFITLPILARLIGPEGYGLIAPLMALTTLVYTLLLLGVGTSMKVFIPVGTPEQRRRDLWGIVQVTLLTGVLAVILLVVLFPAVKAWLLPAGMTPELYIAGVAIIPVSALQIVLYAQIINNQQGSTYAGITAVTSLIDLVLVVGGAYCFGVMGLLVATLLSQGVLCALMLRPIHARDAFTRLSWAHLPALKKYYTYGLTMLVAGLASLVVDSSDRFIIGNLLGTTPLGIYQAAYSVSSYISNLSVPVFAALMPLVVTAVGNHDPARARHHLEQSYRVLTLLFAPVVLLLSLNGRDLLLLLTTEEFVGGAVVLPFVAMGIACDQVMGIYNYNLVAHRRGQWLIVSTGAGAIVNVVLNLIFVPIYGLVAAAISTMIAYLVIAAINWYFSRQSLPVGLSSGFLLRVGGAVLGMAGVNLVLQHVLGETGILVRLAVVGLAGMGMYLALIFGLGACSPDERAYLVSAARTLFKRRRL